MSKCATLNVLRSVVSPGLGRSASALLLVGASVVACGEAQQTSDTGGRPTAIPVGTITAVPFPVQSTSAGATASALPSDSALGSAQASVSAPQPSATPTIPRVGTRPVPRPGKIGRPGPAVRDDPGIAPGFGSVEWIQSAERPSRPTRRCTDSVPSLYRADRIVPPHWS
jgi:hypothetical protein